MEISFGKNPFEIFKFENSKFESVLKEVLLKFKLATNLKFNNSTSVKWPFSEWHSAFGFGLCIVPLWSYSGSTLPSTFANSKAFRLLNSESELHLLSSVCPTILNVSDRDGSNASSLDSVDLRLHPSQQNFEIDKSLLWPFQSPFRQKVLACLLDTV